MQNRDIAGHSISAAAKILKIKSLLTSNARADEFVNPEVISSYNHKTNTIFINIDWVDELDESSEIEIISTCFHETRHAYQWQCIRTGC